MRIPHECSVEWHRFPAVVAEPLARAWLDLVELRGRDPKTIDAYGRGLNEFIAWLDGRSPTAVDELDAYTFIRHLQTRGNVRQLSAGGALKNATLQQKVTVVRLFYDDLLRRKLIAEHPLPRGRWSDNRRDRVRGVLPRDRRLPWIPDDDQWRRFLDVVRHEPLRTRLMTLLAYEGALRRETLVGLEVGDVDLPNRLIKIRPEIVKGGQGNVVVFSAPTANTYARYLPELKAVASHSRRKNNRLFRSVSDRNYGAGLSPWSWNKIVGALGARADLPRFSPHTFRHLRLTHMARAGFELLEIARYAGHRQLETTMIYIHLSGRDLGEKVERNMRIMDEQLVRVAEALA
jgi:integrase/recombinase XerD